MVFVEANQEHTLKVLDWRVLANSSLLKGVDFEDVTGILKNHKLTEEEFHRQAEREIQEYEGSFEVLGRKEQLKREPPLLGESPVCVIKGNTRDSFQKMLDAGLEGGNGVGKEEEVEVFREILRGWDEKDRGLQKEILGLSTRKRYIETEGSGHNVHLTEPEVIVEAVRRVLQEVAGMENLVGG